MSAVLPQLNIDSSVKQGIQNVVGAGKKVQIPEREIQINQWTGIGYVISDPIIGSGAYLISGGLNGGSGTSELALSSLLVTKGETFSCIAETAGNLLYAAAIIVGLIMSRGHPWFAGIGGTIFFYLAVAFMILVIIAIISNCISLGRAGAANNACKRTFS